MYQIINYVFTIASVSGMQKPNVAYMLNCFILSTGRVNVLFHSRLAALRCIGVVLKRLSYFGNDCLSSQ